MALTIESEETDRLARELAALTGEGIAEAVTTAVAERLARERRVRDDKVREIARRRAAIDAILEGARRLPVLDPRPDDELLGYGELGTFD